MSLSMEFTHGGVGPGGFLGDENDLALACITAFPFAFFGFEWNSGWRRWAFGSLGILLLMAVVASFSRGGFVGLVAAAGYCLALSRHKLRNFGVMVMSALALFALSPQEYIDEIGTIRAEATGEQRGTGESRQFLWTTAYNMWKDQPVLGVGGGNFSFLAGAPPARLG